MRGIFFVLFTFQLICKSVYTIKYKIERSSSTAKDTVYLNLNGNPTEKCIVSLLTYQNDTFSYQPITLANQDKAEVSCVGVYSFLPGETKDTYYVRVSGSTSPSDIYLTLRNIFEKPLYAKALIEDDKIVFETIRLCSGNSVCKIKENNIAIKYMSDNVECHHFGTVSTEFITTKDRVKLFCGEEQAPLYVYTRNTHLVQDQAAKQFSLSMTKGSSNTVLNIQFSNAKPEEMCDFHVREGTSSNTWIKNCGLTSHSDKCFRPCNNVTMTLTSGTEQSYTLKIKTKYMIGKNVIDLEDITDNSVVVRLDLLAEAKHHCELKLYYEEYPGHVMTNICGDDGNTRCDTQCSIKKLTNLKPNTRYRLVVIRTSGYETSVSFKTTEAELLNLVVHAGLNSAVVIPSTNPLAQQTFCMVFIQNENTGVFHPARCIHSDRCVNTCSSTFEVIGLKQHHLYSMKVVPFSHYSEKKFQVKTKNNLDDYSVVLTQMTGEQVRVQLPRESKPDTFCDYTLYSSNREGDRLKLAAQCDYTTHCSVKCDEGFIIDNKASPKITRFSVRPRHFGVAKTFLKKPNTDQYVNIHVTTNNDPNIEVDYEVDRMRKYADPSLDVNVDRNPVQLTLDEADVYDILNVRAHKKRILADGNVIIMDPNHDSNVLVVRDTKTNKYIPPVSNVHTHDFDGKIATNQEPGKNKIIQTVSAEGATNVQGKASNGGTGVTSSNGSDKTQTGASNPDEVVDDQTDNASASESNNKKVLFSILGVLALIALIAIVLLALSKRKKKAPIYAVAQITR